MEKQEEKNQEQKEIHTAQYVELKTGIVNYFYINAIDFKDKKSIEGLAEALRKMSKEDQAVEILNSLNNQSNESETSRPNNKREKNTFQ